MKARNFFSKFILDYFNKRGIKLLISLLVKQTVKDLAEMKRRIDAVSVVLIQFGGFGPDGFNLKKLLLRNQEKPIRRSDRIFV